MSIVTRHTYTEVIGADETRVKNEVTQYRLLGIPFFIQRRETWRKGSEVNLDLRRVVRWMDNDECVYCGTKYIDKARFAVDHIMPQVQNGPSHIFNLALACMRCNSAKSGHTPNEAGLELAYGRFFLADDGTRMAAGWKKDWRHSIPLCFTEYRYYETINDGILGKDALPKDEYWRRWCEMVKDFGYGEPFNTEFITCQGKIPFLY